MELSRLCKSAIGSFTAALVSHELTSDMHVNVAGMPTSALKVSQNRHSLHSRSKPGEYKEQKENSIVSRRRPGPFRS